MRRATAIILWSGGELGGIDGVLAMGWQVRPDLSAGQMKNLLLASAREIEGGHRIIDPENFIRQVQAAK
jgi:hypothetical protein